MKTQNYSSYIIGFLLYTFVLMTANASEASCHFTRYDHFEGTSDNGTRAKITIKKNSLQIKTDYSVFVASTNQHFKTGCLHNGLSKFKDAAEQFTALFPDKVNNINTRACGIYFISKNQEFYILPSKKESVLFLFEYSSIDPPSVYTLNETFARNK